MNKVSALLLLVPIFLFVECGSKKETAKKAEGSSPKNTTVMKSDTVPQPPLPPPGLAPGQAKVKAEITAIDKNKPGTLNLKVENILGYGAATPPIAIADTLEVHYNGSDQNEISIGKIVSLVISYRYRLDDTANSPLWTFVSFDKDPN